MGRPMSRLISVRRPPAVAGVVPAFEMRSKDQGGTQDQRPKHHGLVPLLVTLDWPRATMASSSSWISTRSWSTSPGRKRTARENWRTASFASRRRHFLAPGRGASHRADPERSRGSAPTRPGCRRAGRCGPRSRTSTRRAARRTVHLERSAVPHKQAGVARPISS